MAGRMFEACAARSAVIRERHGCYRDEEIIRDELEEAVRLRGIEERMEKLERTLKRLESPASKDL